MSPFTCKRLARAQRSDWVEDETKKAVCARGAVRCASLARDVRQVVTAKVSAAGAIQQHGAVPTGGRVVSGGWLAPVSLLARCPWRASAVHTDEINAAIGVRVRGVRVGKEVMRYLT